MNRTATLTLVVLAAATAAAPAAVAGPKPTPKPITKTYTATAPLPDPTNVAGGYTVCAQNVPQSFHTEEFKVPAAGVLKVELTDYQVDWDLLLMDAKKKEIASSGSGGVGEPEVAQIKFKKPGVVSIVACNWSGGPTGTVKYTFTFAK
jgi:hypothetical protein